jgi:glycosyltransferase involved in cell wall biosynthesis
MLKLSIIVPVYNEENLVLLSLPPIFNLPINKEVLVIDDGSSDHTLKILEDLKKEYEFKLITQKVNQGKGAAIKKGLENINGDYFIICDADLEYDPQDIITLFNKIQKYKLDKKVVIYGSRFKNKPSLSFHYLVNTFLTKLTNLLFFSHLTDMETCFKLVPKEALLEITLSGKRFEFEPEITSQLLKKGYKIKEIPISYNRRSYKEGKKITAKDGFLAVKTLIRERFKK